MGSGQSIPTGMPSRRGYAAQSLNTQTVVNSIFVWMLNQADVQDILKLADQKHCKDYVFITQNALKQFFHELKLDPRLGAGDTLLFDSVKSLTFASQEDEKARPELKAYRDNLCLQLAFFYVRIFQIFGALALTVIDALPEAEAQTVNIRGAVQVLGRGPQRALPGARPQAGGKVTEADRDYIGDFVTIAPSYFTPVKNTDAYVIASNVSGKKTYNPTADVRVLFYFPNESQNLIFRSTSDIEVAAHIEPESITQGKSYTLSVSDISVNSERVSSSYRIPFTYGHSDYTYNSTSIASALTTIMSSVARSKGAAGRLDDILGKRDQKVGPVSDAGTVQGLSYAGILKYMKDKPKAHCVARAMTLLSPTLLEGIRQGTPNVSNICYYTATADMPDSVPNYGQAITTHSPGIRAFHQLFFDMIDGTTPKISQEVKPKYKEFVSLMQTIFAPPPPAGTADTLDRVISKPFPKCEEPAYKDQQIIVRNREAVRIAREKISKLLTFQLQHAANVMAFMKKYMFVFDKENRIKGFNPSLLKNGGIPQVNILADTARSMLANYYKTCEGEYRLGAIALLAAPDNQTVPRPK